MLRILAGGKRKEGSGFFYEATLIADLKQDDELIQTEIFGPVVLLNGSATRKRQSHSPTAPSTGSRHRCGPRCRHTAARLAARLDFGCVWINARIPLVAEMPHGGQPPVTARTCPRVRICVRRILHTQ